MSYGHILQKLRDGDLNLQEARQKIVAASAHASPKEVRSTLRALAPVDSRVAQSKTAASNPGDVPLDTLQRELIESLANVLYMEPANIGLDHPFSDLGLDSLISVEWINAIKKQYQVRIAATKVYDYPTLETLSKYLKTEIERTGVGRDSLAITASNIAAPENLTVLTPVSPPEKEPATGRSPVLKSPAPAKSKGSVEGLRPEDLGSPIFQKRHGCRASYFAGSMYRGVASERMVVAMARTQLLSFFGSAGFSPAELEPRIQSIQSQLMRNGVNPPYGMCLISDLRDPDEEMAHVDLFVKYNIPAIEASAFLSITPALAYCRLQGIAREGSRIVFPRRIIAKCSRLEVARRFCSPAPMNIVNDLVAAGRLTPEEARLSQLVPMASDIAAEADSGGHTDQGVAFCLLPSIVALKESLARDHGYEEPILVGCGGGIGTPEAVAAAFAMGADFVFTGSINQCTLESGAHEAVKELLSTLNIHDTGIAPAADMFEIGARVQVVRKKTRFPERANRLYQLFQQYQSIGEIPPADKEEIEARFFKKSFADVWKEVCVYKNKSNPEQIQTALENPRLQMKLIFHWYMVHSNQVALTGDLSEKDNFQIHCGPAMGAFNQWVKGTDLEDWKNRRVAHISDLLLRKACEHIEGKWPQPKESAVDAANVATAGSYPHAVTPARIASRDRELQRQDIAVIGMAGRFPMAADIAAFWDNLVAGRDCISEVSPDRWPLASYYDPTPAAPGKTYSKWMGMLEDVDKFDPLFFNIPPVEAEAMDPQQRLFLQSCWTCIENAGYNPLSFSGSRCGVFAGCGTGDYALGSGGGEMDASALMGGSMSILAARISYVLNLQGPCMAIDTACSSSLVAIASACDSLTLGTSDLALAGGVSVMAGPVMHILTSNAGMLSPDGRCFTFDQRANGFVPGEGVGVVLLKRLADAERDGDRIDAVIRGWGVNQDGKTNGITAPSGDSQTRLEKYVYDRFGLNPENVQMVETHGTGTKLGDPIEVAALKASFQEYTSRKHYCALGSLKSNVGHLLAASGVAGLIKSALALKYRQIPPTLHFETLNEHIELGDSPFYVNTACQDWEVQADEVRRAAVSGFGFSGTNAHIVLEEYPSSSRTDLNHEPPSPVAILLSAKSEDSLREMGRNLLRYIDGPFKASGFSLHDLAYTLQIGRAAMTERLAFVAGSEAELKTLLLRYIAGDDGAGLFRGRIQLDKGPMSPLAAGVAMNELVEKSISQRDYIRLMELWVGGFDVDWKRLHTGLKRRRAALPAYPFARERYWRQPKYARTVANETAGVPDIECVPTDRGLTPSTLLYRPVWKTSAAFVDRDDSNSFIRHTVLLGGSFAPQSAAIESELPGTRCVALRCATGDIANYFETVSCQAFETIKALMLQNTGGKTLVQVLLDSQGGGQLLSGLGGLLRTATLENPAISGQVIELGEGGDPAAILLENRSHAGDAQVRYVDGKRLVLAFEELADLPDEPSRCWRDGGVYLITGGGGGLGLLFAQEIAVRAVAPRLILVGRSPVNDQTRSRLEMLTSAGAHVEYKQVDVADEESVARLMAGIRRDHGRLDGVLHAAGTIRDNFLTRKTTAEFRAVLAPKVKGAVLLERASRELAPAWIALFSSCSGVTGNLGQADYAAANAFMDEFAHWHRLNAGDSPTRVVSIDWPLWQDGGMGVDEPTLTAIRERTGSAPMKSTAGLQAFYQAMASGTSRILILSGDATRIRRGASSASPAPYFNNQLEPLPAVEEQELRDCTLARVKLLVGETINLASQRINEFEPLESYGIDSILVTRLNLKLGRVFPGVSQTLLFEVRNLRQLADHLIETFRLDCVRWTALDSASAIALPPTLPAAADIVFRTRQYRAIPETKPSEDKPREDRSSRALDIAIIGLSGRYPMSPDVNSFWANLRDGRDCITEVPAERWNWRDYYSGESGNISGHSSKWGGFIDDVDKFDPRFFNISPGIASYLDPQERLILEETWKALEDAGCRPQDLQAKSDEDAEPPVGVYIGSTYTEYQLFGPESTMAGKPAAFAGNLASIANRVSYVLDLHGPSVAVDTMCSSSLTCVHLACQDLKAGRTRLSIVGSVNLSIHPNKYLVLSGGQFLSSHGRCKSFGEGGDGYIPSEGVGVVLLKRLADAERDGDHIYGVIKGSAVNHSGRTNGYSVPSPDAQKRVIKQALDEACIHPREVSYVEAHGTGTKLGDPIEIVGLAKAFGLKPNDTRCWIGSAKSNIGHCEAAAGLAGITKVLLQMKHRQIAPSIHSQVLNPRIDFASTPFEVNQELRDWQPPMVDGKPGTRVAGVSAFGAGGSNAHVVIEEYTATPPGQASQFGVHPSPTRRGLLSSALIVLSARNERQLRDVAADLFEFLKDPLQVSGMPIQDIAFTLQVGRKPMEERLGFAVASTTELRDQLGVFLHSGSLASGHIRGRVEEFSANGEPGTAASDLNVTVERLAHQRADSAILQLWVSGFEFDWHRLHGTPPPARVSLPTYPFSRQRYWAEQPPAIPGTIRALKVAEPAETPAARNADEVSLPLPAAAAVESPFAPTAEKPKHIALLPLSASAVSPTPDSGDESAVEWGAPARPVPVANPVAASKSIVPAPGSSVSRESLEESLLASLAKTLCMEPDEIRPNTPFVNMGLDSVVGVEWVQQINQKWTLNITAATVYDHPTLRQFAAFVHQQIEGCSPAASPSSPPPSAPPDITGEPLLVSRLAPVIEKPEKHEKPARIVLAPLSANALSTPHPLAPAPVVNRVAASQSITPAPASSLSRESLEESLLASLAKTLCMEPDEIRPNTPFVNMGLDSVVGVEWVQQINQKWALNITAATVYDHPTLRQFTAFIYQQIQSLSSAPSLPSPAPSEPPDVAAQPADLPQSFPVVSLEQTADTQVERPVPAPSPTTRPGTSALRAHDIAVIGIAGRFPGAADVEALWSLLENGRSAFSSLPHDRDWDLDDRNYVRRGAFLEEIDCFDPLFFQMSPKEAAALDPCERLFLEESWKALEDAGIDPTQLSGRRWGVFCGNGGDYSLHLQKVLGYSPRVTLSHVPTRVSYCLNLTGPSQSVDVGCASALLAIAQACDQISMGKCEAAIAGGALIHSTPNTLISACQLDLLSRQETGSALDAQSEGMMPGEAVGAVILKPLAAALADGDRIHCVIEGWGNNHNGKTHGIVAPSVDAQANLFSEVHESYGIDPATVTFVEANASGMPLADRAEIQALSQVFSSKTDRHRSCALGTVENNIGHAFHASGISHFMKTVLALRHRRIPATLNVHKLHETSGMEKTPFFINSETVAWNVEPGQVRRAAVSSFGATGSNVHLVVSEAPAVAPQRASVRTGPVLIVLSARTTDGLRRRCRDLADWLQSSANGTNADLRRLSANLLLRRTHFGQRCAFVVSDASSLRERLSGIGEGQKLDRVFLGSVEPESELSPALSAFAASKISEVADKAHLHPEDLLVLADLYAKGVRLDMSACFTRDEKAVMSYPGYPFERRRCWISGAEAPAVADLSGEIVERLKTFVCELTGLLPAEVQTGRSLRYYGVDSLISMRLLNRINAFSGLNFSASLLLNDTLEEMARTIQDASPKKGSNWGADVSLSGTPQSAWRRPAFIERLDFEVPSGDEAVSADDAVSTDDGEAQLERLLHHGCGVWAEEGKLCLEFFRGTRTRGSLQTLLSHPGSLKSILAARTRYYPAAYMQRLALNASEVDRTSAFNIGQAFWIDTPVNRDLLNRAFSDMTQHHSILRTGARRVGKHWAQVVHDTIETRCREEQWSEIEDRDSFLEALGAYQKQHCGLLFDIHSTPLLEVCVLHNGRDLGAVYFHAHHFHADGFTLFLFQQELHQRYRALVEDTDLKPPAPGAEYAHFALSLFDPANEGNTRFWQDQLDRQIQGPMLQDRPEYVDSASRKVGVLAIDTATGFLDGARRSGVTLTQMAACAVAVLTYRLTGRNMAVQMVYNLRDRYEFENVFGDFSSSAPLVLNLQATMTLREVFECYRGASVELQTHKRFDLMEIVGQLAGLKKWSGLSIDSNDRDALCQVTDFASRLIDMPLEDREPVAPLVVCLVKTGERLTLQLLHDKSLLSSRTIGLFGQAMKELLVRMTNESDLRIVDFEPPPELLQRLNMSTPAEI